MDGSFTVNLGLLSCCWVTVSSLVLIRNAHKCLGSPQVSVSPIYWSNKRLHFSSCRWIWSFLPSLLMFASFSRDNSVICFKHSENRCLWCLDSSFTASVVPAVHCCPASLVQISLRKLHFLFYYFFILSEIVLFDVTPTICMIYWTLQSVGMVGRRHKCVETTKALQGYRKF